VTFLINHMLTDNNARLITFGTNSYLNMNNRPIAVKTGTTNDRKDNWTIGWSNSAMVGVWVGNNDNSSMKSVTSGVTGAAPIWRRIMLDTLAKHQATDWKIPENVEAKMVDIISGYPEHDGFPARSEYVIKGTLPPLPDPVHQKMKVCQGQEDKLAPQASVEMNNFVEKEFITPIEDKKLGTLPSWLEQVAAWAQTQTDNRFKAPTEYCGSTDDVVVRVDTPNNETNIDSTDVPVKARVITTGEVQKVEVYVDDKLVETMVESPYETTLSLTKGKHILKVKAYRKDGKTGEGGAIKLGVGGTKWNE